MNHDISKGTPLPGMTIAWPGSSVIVSWPSLATGFVLQQNCDACSASGWSTSGYTLTHDGTNKSITVSSPTSNLFFRLVGN